MSRARDVAVTGSWAGPHVIVALFAISSGAIGAAGLQEATISEIGARGREGRSMLTTPAWSLLGRSVVVGGSEDVQV